MKKRLVFIAVMTLSIAALSIFSTTGVSAASIEPGDENYIRVGGQARGCAYTPVPEPIYTQQVIRTGNGRECILGPKVVTGYSSISDGAAGFVRADYTANPLYGVIKNEILSNVAADQAKGRTYDHCIVGSYVWTPQSEAEKAEYLNIAKNVIVDMVKDGLIKNGYVGFMDVATYTSGKLRFDGTPTEPKYYYYNINTDYSGDNANQFFAKYPHLKKYYKNGR